MNICHVVPAGCSSHTGKDRWTKFSFPVVYNSDRQQKGNKEPERQSTTEKELIIEMEKKKKKRNPLKKEPCRFKVEMIPKNLKVP